LLSYPQSKFYILNLADPVAILFFLINFFYLLHMLTLVLGDQVTERFRDRVVDEGYSPSYGARPLRRAIMRLLEDSMAERMLAGEIKEGDSAIIDVDSEGGVTVLNGTTGTSSSTAINEAPAGIA
jgi:hypothetical protein